MEYITDLLGQLLNAKVEVIAMLGVLCVGYAIRMLPFVPNKYIPLICFVVGTCAYAFLKPTSDVPQTTAHPVLWKCIVGFIISFATWALHKAAIKPIEEKFPWLKSLFDTLSGENSDGKVPPAEPK